MPEFYINLLDAKISTVVTAEGKVIQIGGDNPLIVHMPAGSTVDGVAATVSDAEVTGSLMTGFSSAAGTVSSADTVLEAMNKLDGNIEAITLEHEGAGEIGVIAYGTGTAINDDTRFSGHGGSDTFTIGDIVTALKSAGILRVDQPD